MGKASGNTFALDIDVDVVDLSMRLVDLAEDMLGPSPFRRIGQYPRVALIFRYGRRRRDPVEVMAIRSRRARCERDSRQFWRP